MMKCFRFKPVKQYLRTDELGNYVSYGIHAFTLSPSGCTESGLVFDISCNPGLVSHLADLCTRLQLDPCQLDDVVQDFLP